MNSVEIFGYKVFENGVIKGKNGFEMKQSRQIKVFYNNSCFYVDRARFIYYAFHQDSFDMHDKKYVIKFKDNNKHHYHINNLIAVPKSLLLQGENNVNAKLSDSDINRIKIIYNQNKDKKENKNNPMSKISYRRLADMYGVSHSMIGGIIKGQFRNKENYVLK